MISLTFVLIQQPSERLFSSDFLLRLAFFCFTRVFSQYCFDIALYGFMGGWDWAISSWKWQCADIFMYCG